MNVANITPLDSDDAEGIKLKANELAAMIERKVLPGRRKSLALTNLEQATMWAIKALTQGDE